MKMLMSKMRNFLQEEDGVTAIEYGLIASLVAVIIIGAVTNIGTSLRTKFNAVSVALGGAAAN